MDKAGKRGKIPQTDWPLIMARYDAGETLSSIARTYDCSPPAISYIVSRSKAKPASESTAPAPVEAQLVKASANGVATNGSSPVEPMTAPPAPAVAARREPSAEARPAAPTDGAMANGEQRRKLHLSLGGGNGGAGNGHAAVNGSADGASNGNGQGASNGNGHGNEASHPATFTAPRPPSPLAPPQGVGERMAQRPPQAIPPRNPQPFDGARNGRDPFAAYEARSAAQQPRDAETTRKDNGAFIDQELRSRVDGDIAAFLAAFDAALAADTHESRFGLREATDRLLRAGARTRIELERLEARVPLPTREGGVVSDPGAWRHR